MASLAIRQFPDPLLKQPTRRVERIDAHVNGLIKAMVALMRKQPRCVGLAAPQVGSRLRLAVMDAADHPKAAVSRGLIVLINPCIDRTEGAVVQREGCLSVPDFTANVRRAERVHLSARDQAGVEFSCWLEGFEAIIAQHEIDHLDGKLFLDRVANLATDVFRRKTYF